MTDPWDVQEKDYPEGATAIEKLRFLVNYAVLAPSSYNSQPWRFILGEARLLLCADRSRRLPVLDPFDRELVIGCGTALAMLMVAARYFGHEPLVHTFPDPTNPDVLASIALGTAVQRQPECMCLFSGLLKRRTTREVFIDKPVPAQLIDDLRRLGQGEQTTVHAVQDRVTREELAALVSAGDRHQFADPAFRQELARWLRSRRSGARDGVAAEGFDIPDSLNSIGALVVRTFDIGRGVAARDGEIAAGSPLLLLLASAQDTPAHWLHVGQSLGRVLLRAAASDVSVSFLNQAVEVPSVRTALAELLQIKSHPQMLLRMGYSHRNRPSVRRPLHEVLERQADSTIGSSHDVGIGL